MRIGIAAILIYDLGHRMLFLEAHYSDAGIIPRTAVIDHGIHFFDISIHFLSGLGYIQALLMIAGLVFGFMLLIGYQTRLATIASWFLLLSLHNRNPILQYGGDYILLFILFWGMFLPWGAHYAVDRPPANKGTRLLTLATGAYVIQIGLIYLFAALTKSGDVWTRDFTAVYYTLANVELARPFGQWIWHFPSGVLSAMTIFVLALEYLVPVLLLAPFLSRYFRLAACLGIAGLHLGFGLSITLGIFPWVGIASMLGLLPAPVMDKFDRFIDRWLTDRRDLEWLKHHLRIGEWLPPVVPVKLKLGWLSRIAVAACITLIVWTNLWTIGERFKMPHHLYELSQLIGIAQGWQLFAPAPPDKVGWYVMPGTLEDGSSVDLLTQSKAVNWEKPAYVSDIVPHDRWMNLLQELSYDQYYMGNYANYLCRQWNLEHSGKEALTGFSIFFMEETILPNHRFSPPRKIWFGTCDCRTGEFVKGNDR